MKTTAIFLIIMVINWSCSPTVDQVALKAEIEKANSEFAKAVSDQDAEAVSQLYTEDARLMFAHMPAIEGRDNIKAALQQSIEQGMTGIKLFTEAVRGTDEFAIEEGKYELMAGDNKIDEGKYLVYWKKVDGRWLLHRDMPTTNAPLPQTAAQPDQSAAGPAQ